MISKRDAEQVSKVMQSLTRKELVFVAIALSNATLHHFKQVHKSPSKPRIRGK